MLMKTMTIMIIIIDLFVLEVSYVVTYVIYIYII